MEAGVAIIEQDDHDPIRLHPLLRLRHPHLAPAAVSATADADHHDADEEDRRLTIVRLEEEVGEAAEAVEAIEAATIRVEIAPEPVAAEGEEAVLLLRALVPVRENGKAVVAAAVVGVVTTAAAGRSAIEGKEKTKSKSTKLQLVVGTARKARRCSKAPITNNKHSNNRSKVPRPRSKILQQDRDAAADDDTAIITIDPRVEVLSVESESGVMGVTAATTTMTTIR